MKKLFTLIALVSAIIPALHGMDTNLPADMQKKYDNLTVLIQNADIEAFKPAFDALTLPAENIAALRQTVAETKAAITNELESMGDKTKSWSKIVKGTLAGAYGLSNIALVLQSTYYNNLATKKIPSTLALFPSALALIPLTPLAMVLRHFKVKPRIELNLSMVALISLIAYKAIPYGIKTLKTGWNYKEHLQNMLVDLDAIDAHIAQAKA